jgi:hypothetical protein
VDPTGYGEGDYDLSYDYDYGPPPGYDDYLTLVRAGFDISYSEYETYLKQENQARANLLSTLPIVGTLFDIGLGVDYYNNDDYLNAAISFFGIVSGFGDLLEAAKELKTLKAMKGFENLNCVKPVREGAELFVIGTSPEYTNVAKTIGAQHFNIPTKIWERLSDATKLAMNDRFIDSGIEQGAEFLLITPTSKNISLSVGC